MNDPIRVQSTSGGQVTVVFFYPQVSPATDAFGDPFVPSPSASIPSKVQATLTQEEINWLDSGTEVAETLTATIPAGVAPADMLARLRVRYANRLAAFPGWYNELTEYFQYEGAKYAAS